jgi:ABC-type bacteriocin/lantibiotic exporter with double-glycine peptidase domain
MSSVKPVELPAFRDASRQFGRLILLVRPYWGPLVKGMVLSLTIGLVSMAPPYLAKLLVDRVYMTDDVPLMHVLVGGILAVGLATALMGAIRTYFTGYTTWNLSNAAGLLFFNHLQHLRIRFFDQHRVGEISSRFQEVRTALVTASRLFESLLVNGAPVLLVPPILLLLNWRLGLVALAVIPLSVFIILSAGQYLRRYQKRSAEAYAGLGAFQVEVLSHIRTFKAMGLEPEMFRKADGQAREAVRLQLRGHGYAQLFNLLNGVVKAVGMAVFMWYAWVLIMGQQLTLGDYVAFIMYVGVLSAPLNQLVQQYTEFQQSAVSLGRMFEYLDQEPEQDPASAYLGPQPFRQVVRGDIRIRDVTFGYAPDRPILHGADLTFPRGSITAVVGPSGAGKSTLFRLVMGMEDPVAGQVLIDGVPLSRIPLADLRRQVGVVWQEVSLVRGTLWENLTLGADDPTPERVDEAVRLCRLEELVREARDGYQTAVAEWGSTLSGGQRQRIALARALIRDTPVLLLDEATSNLDMETEGAILKELFARYAGRTLVFVTHRTGTAAGADRICVVEGGRVVGVGTHDSLLDGCDPYRRMCGAGAQDEARRVPVVAVAG